MAKYALITQNCAFPSKYNTPEEQGAAIVKCSILESTNIEYCNQTKDTQIRN